MSRTPWSSVMWYSRETWTRPCISALAFEVKSARRFPLAVTYDPCQGFPMLSTGRAPAPDTIACCRSVPPMTAATAGSDCTASSVTPIGDFTASLLTFYAQRIIELTGSDLAAIHDACAVLAVTHPQCFEFGRHSVHVELDGRYTRGMTVIDQRIADTGSVEERSDQGLPRETNQGLAKSLSFFWLRLP